MIPPYRVKRKLDGVVDNVTPDESYEVLDGELTEKEWGENENETVADSDDEDITVSKNDVSKPEGESMPESESVSVDPELNLLLTQRKKLALPTFFHFWSELKIC